MIRLSIFRHAKSDWDTNAASDFDRPLASRGKSAAPAMGKYIMSISGLPDLVYCSSSLRTRQTFSLAFPKSELQPAVVYNEKLYLAEPNQILRIARSTQRDSEEVQISNIMFIRLFLRRCGCQIFSSNQCNGVVCCDGKMMIWLM